ncbi:hypothetical protein Mnod_4999 [Methylobacterium nodulans ORS 2060]|uniref:Uncharacterized protein n=1 Tax=Methylobacterium nodulans (strain LMG 21967 / CNCM I-2342 / ORS 2060) TaxID=460265 RepID=B8IIH6_METNO|nr:hypothetical protein Mnod_4999 [Methylobacterium nodulans ORS 2060]
MSRRNPRRAYDENGREIQPPAMSEAARRMTVRTAILLAVPLAPEIPPRSLWTAAPLGA